MAVLWVRWKGNCSSPDLDEHELSPLGSTPVNIAINFFPLLQLFEDVVEPLSLIVGHSTVWITNPIWLNCPLCNRHDVCMGVCYYCKRSAPYPIFLNTLFLLVDGRAPSYQWDIQTHPVLELRGFEVVFLHLLAHGSSIWSELLLVGTDQWCLRRPVTHQ